MKRSSLLHRTFQTGIALKGIDGILETIGGLTLWFISPSRLNEIVRGLLQHELSRDPRLLLTSRTLRKSFRRPIHGLPRRFSFRMGSRKC